MPDKLTPMIEVAHTAITRYDASSMYAMVNDVESYPRFLSWCTGAEILRHADSEMRVRMEIGIAPMSFAFVTRNQLVPDRAIHLKLVDGPFSALHGGWQFEDRGSGCEVGLRMAFEFDNPLLRRTLSPLFRDLMDRLLRDFVAEAEHRYG